VRVLRNVAGMWLLEECRRAWAREDGVEPRMDTLVSAALAAPRGMGVLDVDDPSLASPGQSPETIASHLVGGWDGTRGPLVRALLESLVVRLTERAHQIEALLGTRRDTIHVVGGASRIAPLMQWLADATGKRVVAGPVEATAIGNAAVQWRTLGAVATLGEARTRIAAMPEITAYEPDGDAAFWSALSARLHG
jgi:rhamnulokinase